MQQPEKRKLRIQVDPVAILERARTDLRCAEAGREKERWREAALLCQRCVEKALTAYLTRRGIAFPLTHDVARLFALARQDSADAARWEEDAKWLAGIGPAPQAAPDAERALRVAKEVVEWVGGG